MDQPSTQGSKQHCICNTSCIWEERGKCLPFQENKKLLWKKKDTLLISASSRSSLVSVWKRQNTTASAAGKQSTKKMKNNNSFSLFARITRPQFSLQHPVQLVFPLIIINRGCKSNPSSVWTNLTLLGTHLIQWRPWRIRSQGNADKIRLFDRLFLLQQIKKKKDWACQPECHYMTVEEKQVWGCHWLPSDPCFKYQRPAALPV